MKITDEQIEKANFVNLPSFLMKYGFELKKVGREYVWKDHDSVNIKDNFPSERGKWYRFSIQEGGDNIAFVRKFMDKSFIEAVGLLNDEVYDRNFSPEKNDNSKLEKVQKSDITIAENDDCKRLFAYDKSSNNSAHDKDIPVYKGEWKTADNMELYKDIVVENKRFAEMAKSVIGNGKNPAESVKTLTEEFGFERTAWLTALNIAAHPLDNRFYQTDKEWACKVLAPYFEIQPDELFRQDAGKRSKFDKLISGGTLYDIHNTHLAQFAETLIPEYEKYLEKAVTVEKPNISEKIESDRTSVTKKSEQLENNITEEKPETVEIGDKFRNKMTGEISEVISLSGALPYITDDCTVKRESDGFAITGNISYEKLLDENLYEYIGNGEIIAENADIPEKTDKKIVFEVVGGGTLEFKDNEMETLAEIEMSSGKITYFSDDLSEKDKKHIAEKA